MSITEEFSLEVANTNDAPTGNVGITGTPTTGQVLTASNDIADVDGMGEITYTWSNGANTLATGTTYILTDLDVGKTITAIANYTDVDGYVESVASNATLAIANIVKLIQIRTAEAITAAQASIELNGQDFTNGSADVVLKFDLYLNAAGIDALNVNATEIRGAEFTISLDTTQVEGVKDFATDTNAAWIMDVKFESGVFDAATNNNSIGAIALGKATAVVDIDTTNDEGRSVVLLEQKIGTVYVNPKADLKSINISIQNIVVGSDAGAVESLSYSTNFESIVSQVVQTLNNIPMVIHYKGDQAASVDRNNSFVVTNNQITQVSGVAEDGAKWIATPVDENGNSTSVEVGTYRLTNSDVYWGRWSSAILTSADTGDFVETLSPLTFIIESSSDDDLQLPVTGTYNYDDIASTSVYDEVGNTGSLTDANLSINFYTNDVTSQYEIDMGAGAQWSNEITASFDPSSGDFLTNSVTNNFDTGDGYMAGTLMGDDGSYAAAVYNVQLGTSDSSNMATGAVLFEKSP